MDRAFVFGLVAILVALQLWRRRWQARRAHTPNVCERCRAPGETVFVRDGSSGMISLCPKCADFVSRGWWSMVDAGVGIGGFSVTVALWAFVVEDWPPLRSRVINGDFGDPGPVTLSMLAVGFLGGCLVSAACLRGFRSYTRRFRYVRG